MAALTLKAVTVEYPIYNSSNRSLRNRLVSIGMAGRIRSDARHVVTVAALDGIDLALSKGDRIGLTGGNGSGKTTLLRTMAGILRPTKGTISVVGSVSTLFALGAGLDVELNGYENILRMGMLLGASHASAEASIPEIEAFTELGEFLAMPVRTYSAGMLARLMFAVATAVHPDILLVDEVIGAGDGEFQKKAQARMAAFVEKASILVFASHSPDLVAGYCERTLRMDRGKIL